MTDRVALTSPITGREVRVITERVEEFKAKGYREAAPKPAPRRQKVKTDDASASE